MYLFVKKSQSNLFGTLGVIGLLLIGFVLPFLFNLQPYDMSVNRLVAPHWFQLPIEASAYYPLGTDDLGRDLFSRLIKGTQVSLTVGVTVVLVSASIGTLLGLAAAVYRGTIDTLVMRLTDLLMTLPSILLAIVIVAVLGAGLVNAMIAITLVSCPRYIRVVRAVALSEMEKQYVKAALAFGMPKHQLMIREVLPNCWAPIIVQATMGLSDAILDIAALGFLGLGAKPPIAEWGGMLADARPFIESDSYMVVLPGLFILFTVLSFNLLGDALRDHFDPKLQEKNA